MRKHPRIKILFSKNIINAGCLKNGLTIFIDRDRKEYKFRNYSATKTQRGDKYKLNNGVFSLMSLGLINFNPDLSGLKKL